MHPHSALLRRRRLAPGHFWVVAAQSTISRRDRDRLSLDFGKAPSDKKKSQGLTAIPISPLFWPIY
jgi:hypothetical protein